MKPHEPPYRSSLPMDCSVGLVSPSRKNSWSASQISWPSYYLERYQTVEVNSTYYHWPAHATFAGWFRRIPDNFLMTVKAPLGLTHRQRLYAPEYWLKRIRGGLSRSEEHTSELQSLRHLV